MATLTPQQWITKMDARIKEIASDKLMTAVIQDTIAHYTPRIFDKGLNSRNMVIGTYSTKSTYISEKSFPSNFKGKGKNGKSVFKNGRNHTSQYFSSGYKQFKGQIGRGTKVNLRLFNELQLDANSASLRKTTNGYDYYLKKDINATKVKGLTKHFGGTPIFNLTKQERAKFVKDYKTEVLRILNN